MKRESQSIGLALAAQVRLRKHHPMYDRDNRSLRCSRRLLDLLDPPTKVIKIHKSQCVICVQLCLFKQKSKAHDGQMETPL